MHIVNIQRLFVLACVMLCSSCMQSTQSPAPVIMHGDKAPNRAGVHTVLGADTVYSISQRYRISMRQLIVKNRLAAPYIIHPGQRLVLPPPQEYEVKAGDSLYTISRAFAVDMSRLSRMNNMRAPYRIYPGQTLRIPDSGAAAASLQTASANAAIAPASKPSQISSQSQVRQTSLPRKITKIPASSGRFMWPLRGEIVSKYGAKSGGMHNDGINIVAKRGASVKAAENGVVVYVGDQIQGFGNLVLLRHDNRFMTAYAHLDSVSVKRGATLKKGQLLGKVGSTGNVDTPQLHFEIRRGTKAIDPLGYL